MVRIDPFILDNTPCSRPLVIAGPCSAESPGQLISVAKELADGGVKFFRAGIWKPRTKPGGFEGVGDIGLKWLSDVKKETGMLTCTEVANARHVSASIREGIDVLWLGARTTANPFAVQEIAEALKGHDIPVLVKNPVNPDIELWIGGIERLINVGIKRVAAVHRGFSVYEKGHFRNQPHWHIPIELKRRFPTLTILCDPSHIGGRQELIHPISQQAMDLGFDGIMAEVHQNPAEALSDKDQQITPTQFLKILSELVIRKTDFSSELLNELRGEIDEIDDRFVSLLSRRMEIAREIGLYKIDHDMPVFQPSRYERMVTGRVLQYSGEETERQFLRQLLEAIHEESVRQQLEIFNGGHKKH